MGVRGSFPVELFSGVTGMSAGVQLARLRSCSFYDVQFLLSLREYC